MSKDNLILIILTTLLVTMLVSIYFINDKLNLITYTNTKCQLDREQMILDALLPLTAPIVEEPKRGKK